MSITNLYVVLLLRRIARPSVNVGQKRNLSVHASFTALDATVLQRF